MLLALALTALPGAATASPQNGHQGDDVATQIAKLRDMLEQPGADGRQARETAVERLLVMPVAEAHRELCRVLGRTADPDALRVTVLRALADHLLGVEATRFGGAGADLRQQIVTGYLGVTARWWLGGDSPAPALAPLRRAAAEALRRVQARELEQCARTLLPQSDADTKAALFFCLADLQHLYLSQVMGEYVEAEDPAVRLAARRALRVLTFHSEEFRTRAQFADWFERNADVRYVDLAERAARAAAKRSDDIRTQLEQARLTRTFDVVRAATNAGIDWALIQRETLVEDPALLRSALRALQEALGGGAVPDDASPARLAFCRALLERWKVTPADGGGLRASLLEVAAYAGRAEEAELAAELQGHLLTGLRSPDVAVQLAALRGLRRYPSVDAREVVVQYAVAAVAQGADGAERVAAALATLSSRAAPRWWAPVADARDKEAWLSLIRSICESRPLARLRDAAIALALTEDAKNSKVPEVFQLLLDVALDTTQAVTLRSRCVIELRNWRYPQGMPRWVVALHTLISDPEVTLRQQAAQALRNIGQGDDPRRAEWLTSTIDALQGRVAVEKDLTVLDVLVEGLIACGSEPEMPGRAIAKINEVIAGLGSPPPEELKSNLEKLLGALAAIASDPDAAKDRVWLDACEPLLANGRRRLLRLLIDEKHSAVDLATEVANADASVAARARQAMRVLIRTALLKPPDEPWANLRGEANDVVRAFNALDPIAAARLDEPVHRVLRLEVELVAESYKKVTERAAAWLANGASNPAPGAAWTPEQKDRVRLLAAEAQLGLQKPDLAARLIAECDPNRRLDARELALFSRVGQALLPSDGPTALALLDRVRRGTPVEDPAFRIRLIDWATNSVRLDPNSRDAVWAQVQPHAALFEGDCPQALKDAFLGLQRTER